MTRKTKKCVLLALVSSFTSLVDPQNISSDSNNTCMLLLAFKYAAEKKKEHSSEVTDENYHLGDISSRHLSILCGNYMGIFFFHS